MTSDRASDRLSLVIPPFRESWQRAFKDIISQYNNPGWNKRTRSVVAQNQAVIHAKDLLSPMQGVTHLLLDDRDLWEIDGVAIIRLKQLDEDLLSKNYPTATAKAFSGQQELKGLGSLPRLTIGMVPQVDWTGIAGIYVTYPKSSGSNNWVLDITGGESKDLNQTLPNELIKPERPFRPKRQDDGVDPRRADVQS